MTDLLVRLYDLPSLHPVVAALKSQKICIRRANPAEAEDIVPWIRQHFYPKWAAECQASLAHRPTTCYLATEILPLPNPTEYPYDLPPERLIGFACYDTVARGMFGPEGVLPQDRGRGIGKALLLACMHAMADAGYAYAVIAWAGPIDFYCKVVGATPIPDSEPGIFRGPLVTG
jgi:GNAT superfamily N-acetyltransferase